MPHPPTPAPRESAQTHQTTSAAARCLAVAVCAIVIAMPATIAAQDTRAGAIAAEQAEKATRLAPRVPSAAERAFEAAKQTLLEEPSGFYPYFGSVYSGGGFTLGAGYRQFTGDRTHWNVAGLYSAKGYKLLEGSAVSPGHLAGRLDLRSRIGWRDATQVPYHGLGLDSPADADSAFRMQQTYVGGDAIGRARAWFGRAGAAYEHFGIENPTGNQASVEDVHDATSAPGVGEDPSYLHTELSGGLDWRPAADYARRGGLYAVTLHRYLGIEGVEGFSRIDTEIVQHIPILRENWVISLRGLLQTTPSDDDLVPYFLLPSLGSGSTLRGYSSWRFRDRHAVLTSAEFRWIPSRLALDLAFFYDAGRVASRFRGLTLDSLVYDYGVGVRFHGPVSTPLRIEIARGQEGVRLVFAASAAF
jgi:outer membrane protein assembly factor BamA